jgi:hypothetical protein
VPHATRLIEAIQSAEHDVRTAAEGRPEEEQPKGLSLEFRSDPDFKLQLKSLDASGIELRNARTAEGVMHATVFVPEGKLGAFIRKLEAYAAKDTTTDKPKNQLLVESIGDVRLASLRSFWTDAGEFPADENQAQWWEVWLQDADNENDVSLEFRRRADTAGVQVGERELRFPERRVLLARATIEQLLAVENLFDLLAELRLAKLLPGEFLALSPRDQAEFIAEARSRIEAPPDDAPSVCHLDTGVNIGHPLVEVALREEHVLAVDPSWTTADRHGHGTEMAGLALYGCLTHLLGTNDPVVLRHRLESVKIWPDQGQNAPELWGEITSQAASRIEIVSPERTARAFCLTVTADGRDEGLPSSWSAALDQASSGAGDEDAPHRLFVVSAGNVALEHRHEYPNRNQVEGTEDPAQSWNALTIGAYTERASIGDPDFNDWQPIATPGQLSPASRTSLVWSDKTWPVKPDIVMEGGNNAIDPVTGRADFVDDLSLLTTRVSVTGAQLTTTGDTSAAAALAARYAAIVWANYPELWPETVRALLVHSARWTDQMRAEFPDNQRHNRLRCYGYGVPNLSKALWSASNAATLIVEGSLQPFYKDGSVKTKDMHLHNLPWPRQVLEDLGEVPVRMRVTLSYFIEPSPGRRGWTNKHRYQSHGLRFEVKRPLETNDEFHKRISKAAREDGEEVEHGSDDREWELGDHLRRKGSIHCDTWTGTAAELAASGVVAVFPVTGWWKERQHLGRWDREARYALIVTIETDETEVDLYTPIAVQIGVPVEAVI